MGYKVQLRKANAYYAIEASKSSAQLKLEPLRPVV